MHIPSCFFIKFLANNKKMTRNPTPAAPPKIIATVFPVFDPMSINNVSHSKSGYAKKHMYIV